MTNRRGLKQPVLKSARTDRPVPGSVAAKEAEGKGTRNTVRPIIVKHLTDNTGLPVHADDMAKMTGAAKSSIQSAMQILVQEGKLNIETIVGGNTWVYRGVKSAEAIEARMPEEFRSSAPVKGTKRLYEEMGTDKTGRRILKDEEDTLWAATEL